MNDRNLLRGLFLCAIASAFGLTSLGYPIGVFGRAGPGLFPLLVSGMLLAVGIATVVRSRFMERAKLDLQVKNIALILGSLCGFAVISERVNMIAGIAFMVFCAGLAASSYSWVRNVKIAVGLVIVAVLFKQFLGLQLPLY